MGKARVALLKTMSTPRMELTADVASVNMTNMLSKELNYRDIETWYHTDSTVVLAYIYDEARQFHIYVENRVQYIRDRSDPKQWCHIAGELNPADEASHGLSATQLIQNHRWLHGLEFLWKEFDQNSLRHTVDLDFNDNKVKKEVTTVLIPQQAKVQEKTFLKVLEADHFTHFSLFNRLKQTIVCIQRMIERKRPNKQYNWRQEKGPSSVRELEEAERRF